MKALVCENWGPIENLKIKDVASLEPGPHEVVIATKTCALNFPDLLIVQGKYQFRPELPFSPGSDVSGIVIKCGDKVTRHKVGGEVFGMLRFGGLAEQTLAHENALYPKPQEINFETAASFLYAYGTSWHALKDRAQLKEGETIVILGASGGVGLSAVKLSKILGAKVIACASTSEKLDLCLSNGADVGINYNEEDLKTRIKELTDGNGADVVFDVVGGNYTEPALRALSWNGRLLVIGFAAGDIPKIPLNLPLLKGCDLRGVFWGRFAKENPKAFHNNNLELIDMFKSGKVSPYIYKTFDLDNAITGLEMLSSRQAMGKVIVKI